MAFDGCREGTIEFPDMSRSMPLFLRSAGDPFSETEVLEILRGVVTFRTPVSEFSEGTRLILI